MGCIALHPAIEELELEKRFDQPFALSIVAVAHPFQKLKHLVLFADAAAANTLLPCITQLERLELTVHGAASVYSSLLISSGFSPPVATPQHKHNCPTETTRKLH
ncbi:hypothetical protein M436DRAFT_82026 [Aureobasidium namibiae CBS 147.97]|uniref:Uncharacterized protein n=1 Tax=Aureobasidium namibiae CBS 147.97 TaxID=1043004 RepID=A0A074WI06_9PEZI|nr:uncharacterized protein M436DRAFT_82026 [Aureobasidium namibiae CBS 147.97]KEQ72745.1 hypothetical protein M436DRAFT_82026 [Aureobasidium namibiae CBS 147.97]